MVFTNAMSTILAISRQKFPLPSVRHINLLFVNSLDALGGTAPSKPSFWRWAITPTDFYFIFATRTYSIETFYWNYCMKVNKIVTFRRWLKNVPIDFTISQFHTFDRLLLIKTTAVWQEPINGNVLLFPIKYSITFWILMLRIGVDTCCMRCRWNLWAYNFVGIFPATKIGMIRDKLSGRQFMAQDVAI